MYIQTCCLLFCPEQLGQLNTWKTYFNKKRQLQSVLSYLKNVRTQIVKHVHYKDKMPHFLFRQIVVYHKHTHTHTHTRARARTHTYIYRNIHKYTWISPDGITHNQIDHVLVDKRRQSRIIDIRSLRGADCDHMWSRLYERDWH